MALYPKLRRLIQLAVYRYNFIKNLKDVVVVPLRHAIFGKKDFYHAVDVAKTQLLQREGSQAQVVFDVGASIGDKTFVLTRLFPKAQIYAFEPLPEAYHRLVRRVAHFGGRVRCFNFGFYNTNGPVNFYLDEPDLTKAIGGGCSSAIPYEKQSYYKTINNKRIQKVEMRRLDDFFKDEKLNRIDFMKIDVEGAEKEFFEGGVDTISKTENIFIYLLPFRKGFESRDYVEILELLYKKGLPLRGTYFNNFLFSRVHAKTPPKI